MPKPTLVSCNYKDSLSVSLRHSRLDAAIHGLDGFDELRDVGVVDGVASVGELDERGTGDQRLHLSEAGIVTR